MGQHTYTLDVQKKGMSLALGPITITLDDDRAEIGAFDVMSALLPGSQQPAIADLNVGEPSTLPDVVTAVVVLQIGFNALLAALRAGGTLAT